LLSFCCAFCGLELLKQGVFAGAFSRSTLTARRSHRYAMAFKSCRSRPSTDPTSWIYQANMHSTVDSPALTAWNGCQHGSFYFFSWHRMYLYYFERILRKASGDPNLALPYWNYTDDLNLSDPDRRQLPLAFRQPAVSSNPLFVSQRNPAMNNGTGFLPPGDVDYSHAFACTNFEAPGGSMCSSSFGFGGGKIPQPAHFSGNYGALEQTPHNVVHVDVGGWMADPDFAARDPIFFLHHANVDRLWNHWLARGGGRQDPTSDQVWMNTMFTFFDENGQQVQLSGKNILDTVSQLNYCYDDEPGCCPQCCRQTCENAFSACVDACPDAGDCPGEPPQVENNCLRAVARCPRACLTAEKRCIASCK
jgi:hypothetical protein